MKTYTVTIPVNARTASAAQRAIRETMARDGRTVLSSMVARVEDVRPFERVAIDFPAATNCFVLTVEYRKDDAR